MASSREYERLKQELDRQTAEVESLNRALYRAQSELAASLDDTNHLFEEHKREVEAIFRSRTWRAGRALAAGATPVLRTVRRMPWVRRNLAAAARASRRVPRKRSVRQAPPAELYSGFLTRLRSGHGGQFASPRLAAGAWHAGRMLAEFGGPEVRLEVPGAQRLADELRVAGWSTDEPWRVDWWTRDRLDGSRLAQSVETSFLETDSVVQLVTANSSSAQQQRAAAAATQPIVVVDARALQGSRARTLGRNSLSRRVLEATRSAAPEHTLVLLTDGVLPNLDEGVATLADEIVMTPYPPRGADVALFVELLPFAQGLAPTVPFLRDPACATVSVVYDLVRDEPSPADTGSVFPRLANRARLEALRHYDLLLPVTTATQSVCERVLGVGVRTSRSAMALVSGKATAPPPDVKQPVLLVATGAYSLETAAAVLAVLAARDRPDLDLRSSIAIGTFSEDDKAALERFAVQLRLSPDALELRSNATDRDLLGLFGAAEVFIESAFSEGFAARASEAVSMGTPVVAADLPAHRDQLGVGPWLAKPGNVDALFEAVEHVRLNRDRVVQQQGEALGHGGDRSEVSITLEEDLQALLAERRTSAIRTFRRPSARPRIAVISPFPPQSSEVGDYTAFTFREVAKYADVEICSSAPGRSAGPWTQRTLSAAPYFDGRLDGIVTVIGDAGLDARVLSLLSAYGGACIAHDIDGIGPLISEASPLFVHSRAHLDRVRGETGADASLLPFVPDRVPRTPTVDDAVRDAARKSLGLADDVLHVAVFRQDEQVEQDLSVVAGALSWLRSWDILAHLHLVGYSSDDARRLGRILEKLRLDGSVTVYDSVPARRPDDFLLGVDVAVELRAHATRLSRVVADCIAFGLPTVATSHSVDDDVPTYVATVGSITSTLLVAEAIESVRHVRERTSELEGERREWLNGRSADSYAQMLLRCLLG